MEWLKPYDERFPNQEIWAERAIRLGRYLAAGRNCFHQTDHRYAAHFFMHLIIPWLALETVLCSLFPKPLPADDADSARKPFDGESAPSVGE